MLISQQIITINQVMKDRNITQNQLAEMSGVSKSTLSKILCGITENPRIDTIEAMQSALGISNELTDEEKALGAGYYPIRLSEDEMEWQELRSEIIRTHGERYFTTIQELLKTMTKLK